MKIRAELNSDRVKYKKVEGEQYVDISLYAQGKIKFHIVFRANKFVVYDPKKDKVIYSE
jgi:hypothetical protein